MKINFKLPKLKSFGWLLVQKYWYLFLAVVAVVLIGYLGFFIYQNFYRTITQAEEIVVLRQEVAPDTIDTKKINEVITAINNKISPATSVNWAAAANPFVPYLPAAANNQESATE